MPVALRERARRVSKRVRKAAADLIREGLSDRLAWYEAKFDAEDARAKAEKEEKRASKGRRVRALEGITDVRLDKAILDAAPEDDSLQKIYAEHAKKIFAVIDRPLERRVRAQEAIAAVKRQAPLTHPLDGEILVALEREVLKLRAAAPAVPAEPSLLAEAARETVSPLHHLARFLEGVVDRTIDPTRTRTTGDV